MTTLTRGPVVITPKLVTGYETKAEARNIFHMVLGRSDDYVSVSDDGLRAGTLELLFDDRTAAWEAFDEHRTAGAWTLADPDVPQINMTYLRDGEMSAVLEDETRLLWTLSIGYREISV